MKKKISRIVMAVLAAVIILSMLSGIFIGNAHAASEVTISTTLVNNSVQRGSKKTFDVFARNSSGRKIESSVALNGNKVSPKWNDTDKTSYTLNFTHEGLNKVVVSAGGKTVTYNITYKKANTGDITGSATFSVELFTLGNGYLIEPERVNIVEGETSADALIKLLHKHGYVAFYGGNTKKSFYLAYIARGNNTEKSYEGYSNSRYYFGAPVSPKGLGLRPNIPSYLSELLKNSMSSYDENDYQSWDEHLGEFVISNGSGWMYCVNNNFPNVSFADTYLSDGDVVRVQFTLGYGADIGGASAMGGGTPDNGVNAPKGNFYSVANKDRLTLIMAEAKSSGLISRPAVKNAYNKAVSVAENLKASQSSVNNAGDAINISMYGNKNGNINSATTFQTSGNSSSTQTSKNSTLSSSRKPYSETTSINVGTDCTSAVTSSVTVTQKDKSNYTTQKDNTYSQNTSETAVMSTYSHKRTLLIAYILSGVLLITAIGVINYFKIHNKNLRQSGEDKNE